MLKACAGGSLWRERQFPPLPSTRITVSLSGNAAAATVSPVTLAGVMINNAFVPRTGNALSLAPTFPPLNLGSFDIVINPGDFVWKCRGARGLQPCRPGLGGYLRSDHRHHQCRHACARFGGLRQRQFRGLGASYTTIRNAMVADGSDEVDDGITASLPTSAQFVATIAGGTMLVPISWRAKPTRRPWGFAPVPARGHSSCREPNRSRRLARTPQNAGASSRGTPRRAVLRLAAGKLWAFPPRNSSASAVALRA